MAIVFHCNYCNKKIEAKDDMGGKWAKCPACHNKIYVPTPVTEGDGELKLAPVDETLEEQKKRLMAETFSLEQKILEEREVPEEGADPKESDTADPWVGNVSEEELHKTVVEYLKHMADGNLDSADTLVRVIRSSGGPAVPIIDKIALAEIPEPELQNIPPQVLAGLIRTLRSQLG